MERRGGLGSWIRNYLIMGVLWSLIINVHAAIIGAVPPLMAAAGPSTGMAKALDIARVLGGEITLWPLGIWERVLRPIFG